MDTQESTCDSSDGRSGRAKTSNTETDFEVQWSTITSPYQQKHQGLAAQCVPILMRCYFCLACCAYRHQAFARVQRKVNPAFG